MLFILGGAENSQELSRVWQTFHNCEKLKAQTQSNTVSCPIMWNYASNG